MGIKGTLKGITATTMIGAGLLGLGGVAQAATESVDLHNASAKVGSDCPNSTGDWRHFVITPKQRVARVHLHHPQCRWDITDIQRWRDRR
jgi:hypothetical protein